MKVKLSLVSLAALSLLGCQQGRESTQVAPASELMRIKEQAQVHPSEGYYLGQVQVRLSDEESLAGFVSNLQKNSNLSVSVIDQIPEQPIFLMSINGTATVDEAVAAIRKESDVTAVSRSYYIDANQVTEAPAAEPVAANPTGNRVAFKTNDPLLSTQWALVNDAQEAPGALAGLKGADIAIGGVDTEGSKDVVVAIIDTGLDYTHEDLAVTETVDGKLVIKQDQSNIWVNPNEIPSNGINDDNNGDSRVGWGFIDDVHGYNFVERTGDPMDDHGHGTHVAGVIGALRNNHKGIAGINAKVSMMGLKFLSARGGGSDFDAQMALYYLMDLKKRFPEKKFITSNSWGAAGRSTKNGDNDDFLLMAFADADRAGILNIAAAGNDGSSNRFAEHYPSNYSNKLSAFLSVAALNNMDQLASFSSYGYDNVQVAAPGVLIMSTIPQALYGKGYEAWSGTSMATPHVTGLAAAVWAKNPQMTAVEVKERIVNTVDKLPQLHGSISTAGRINIRRALSGDVNVSLQPVAEKIPYRIESPRGNDDMGFDWVTPIYVEGAKEIAVCFSRIDLNDGSDWIEVMGNDYRVRDMMTGNYRDRNYSGEERELCSAPVPGDTLNLRLWNAGSFIMNIMGMDMKIGDTSPGLQGYETSYLKVVR